MSGLDQNGFAIKRYTEILTDKRAKAQELFGTGVDTSVNSIFGQTVQLSAIELATLWEELQNVYDSFNPNAAQGKSLDDLCSLVGIYRYDSAATQGFVEFTGSNGTSIPVNTQVSNPDTGDVFQVSANSTISADSAYEVTLEFRTVLDSVEYIVNLDDIPTSFTTPGTGNTVTTLRDGMLAALQANASINHINFLSLDADKIVATQGTIGNSFSFSSNSSSIFPLVVTSLIFVEATVQGDITAEAGSVTQIDTTLSGLDSVTNLASLIAGRSVETDDELRIRRALSASRVGKATPEAIARAIEALQGVTEAFVIGNRTLVTDGDGRPGKSYEVVVVGGELQNIADTIWDVGPAGIETYGSINVSVEDSNGDFHTINFSRPVVDYITFEVDYTLYSEEAFPSNGVQAIKDAIMAYADSHAIIGEDVIPQRYYGGIFSTVSGIETLEIRVGTSADPLLAPVSITTAPIAVGASEVASFSDTRITVTAV